MRFIPGRVVLLFSIVLVFSFFSSKKGFSQATPAVDGFNPYHITLDQRSILLVFSEPLVFPGVMNTAHWSVSINGNPTGIVINSVLQNTARIITVTFNASLSPVAGHGGASYLLPGEILRIEYAGNSLVTASNGLLVIPFGPVVSNNNYAPSATGASDITFNGSNTAAVDGGVLDQCAPVNSDYLAFTYVYSLRFRNSTRWVTSDNRLRVSWS